VIGWTVTEPIGPRRQAAEADATAPDVQSSTASRCPICLQGAVHDAGPIKVIVVRDAREGQRGRSVDLTRCRG